MPRCMICGKEREEAELSGRICRSCQDTVRREAQGEKHHEKRDADRALRASGQSPPEPKPDPER
jgi:hypothetical protein